MFVLLFVRIRLLLVVLADIPALNTIADLPLTVLARVDVPTLEERVGVVVHLAHRNKRGPAQPNTRITSNSSNHGELAVSCSADTRDRQRESISVVSREVAPCQTFLATRGTAVMHMTGSDRIQGRI